MQDIQLKEQEHGYYIITVIDNWVCHINVLVKVEFD